MRTSGRTREQLNDDSLMPKGFMAFEVLRAKEGKSRAGNDQVTVEIGFIDQSGNTRKVTDYLGNSSPRSELKLLGFAEAIGMSAEYAAGNLDADDMVKKHGGFAFVDKQEAQGDFPSKNVIKFYVAELPAGVTETVPPAYKASSAPDLAPMTDDDVPF